MYRLPLGLVKVRAYSEREQRLFQRLPPAHAACLLSQLRRERDEHRIHQLRAVQRIPNDQVILEVPRQAEVEAECPKHPASSITGHFASTRKADLTYQLAYHAIFQMLSTWEFHWARLQAPGHRICLQFGF